MTGISHDDPEFQAGDDASCISLFTAKRRAGRYGVVLAEHALVVL